MFNKHLPNFLSMLTVVLLWWHCYTLCTSCFVDENLLSITALLVARPAWSQGLNIPGIGLISSELTVGLKFV